MSDYDLALILKSLVDSGQTSHSFVTPVGRAVLEIADERSKYVRRLHALKDTLYVFVLFIMGDALRRKALCPDWAIWTFMALAILVAFNFLSKMILELSFFVSSDKSL